MSIASRGVDAAEHVIITVSGGTLAGSAEVAAVPVSSRTTAMNSLKGQLLVATTQLLDPNFGRTVVLILEHNDEGAVGVILNRPTQARVTDLAGQGFDESTDWDKPIHLGGPVPGTVLVLHAVEELSDVEILPGVYSTAEASKIQQLISRQAEPSLILANYAGWRRAARGRDRGRFLDHLSGHPTPRLLGRRRRALG